jgi:hypothetical protein
MLHVLLLLGILSAHTALADTNRSSINKSNSTNLDCITSNSCPTDTTALLNLPDSQLSDSESTLPSSMTSDSASPTDAKMFPLLDLSTLTKQAVTAAASQSSKSFAQSGYATLANHWREIANFRHLKNVAEWDKDVMMPKGPAASAARGAALEAVTRFIHQKKTDERIGWIVGELEKIGEIKAIGLGR